MFFLESLGAALTLLLQFDPELLHIVGVSLNVSFWSTLAACIIGVPAGFLIGIVKFRLKQADTPRQS